MKKQLIFILYDLGISLSALSNLYQFTNIDTIEKVLEGDYLEIQFENQIFTDQDLKLLDSVESINNSRNKIESIFKEFKRDKIEYFIYFEEEYPKLLKKIPSPPFFLFMKGNRSLLEEKFVCSIVGTRTPRSQTLAEIDRFVSEMVTHDIVTASGLALGTDIQVHLSTLRNKGQTVSVLPGPISSIIPRTHVKHASEIIHNQGLLISEYYLDNPHKKTNYVNRNRIISGISNAVIIAECKASSGTMHTARFAYVQKKQLYCFDNDSTGVLKILNSNSAQIYRGVSSFMNIMKD